ncbi:MAG: Protein transport protein S9 plasma membrane t-SNARE [Claussenomyces sp. TS43310]|nr:MAG: Protein transport protein S9 plasma membrane t-SNARE [Claussenomyces sp. TS43310]
MKKFGFGKKKGDDGGRSSNNASPSASNPYARPPPAADPYAQDTSKHAGMGISPYQQAKSQYGVQTSGQAAGSRSDFGAPSGGYDTPPSNSYAPARGPSAQTGGGYGAERYGNGGGYGANRYGGSSAPSRGPSGYGGLGRSNSFESTTTEDLRGDLFSGAKERLAQKAQQDAATSDEPKDDYGADSGTSGGGYGAYGADRQLTAEEEEEEDVQATKSQIRFMKQEDVSSTRNALRIAQQAEETGRATLARLGAQGERIHNTEKNLDLAANHNRVAEEKAKELKKLNRSMFAVHVSNPFTASARAAERDEEIISKHRSEREQRDFTRHAAYGTHQRLEGAFKELQPGDVGYKPKQASKASLAERAKYQFEADSDDDEMENEIDTNLNALGGAASRLNALARATGQEVDEQNKHIDRIITKSDRVDDQIAMNRARLDRIH